MTYALYFLLGGLLGWVAAALLAPWWRQRRSHAPTEVQPPALRLPEIAGGVSAELATLASGIEGNAQLLCEAIDDGTPVEPHAEQLCAVVRRLRTLSETIQLAVGPADVRRQRVRIEDVVASVQVELETASCGRFQLTIDTASSVPDVLSDPRALRQALLLLAQVLFGHEPAAGVLTLRTRNSLGESAHAVVVEMTAEVEEQMSARPQSPAQLALAHEAAANLLATMGAHWTLHVVAGVEATARITLPAADDVEEAPPATERLPLAPRHDFGGALVLERDSAVRSMLGRELERTGRQVFLCADGIAAQTLWRATPERFELLVVEAQGGRAPGEELVAEALAARPETRAVLLGRVELPELTAAVALPNARITVVPQPFGMMELRDALAHVGIEANRAAS